MTAVDPRRVGEAKMVRARALGRVARRALDEDETYALAGKLVRRMEALDPDGEVFARYAACVVELMTAPPRRPGGTRPSP
ncbi:hypothetical protein [Streptodolium elevatio]|uniref:Uncharacterized protein n=1 Tax=Streptodolium elevatio TaxID=3157996 RepID=A0ABV3DQ67_9ACTN